MASCTIVRQRLPLPRSQPCTPNTNKKYNMCLFSSLLVEPEYCRTSIEVDKSQAHSADGPRFRGASDGSSNQQSVQLLLDHPSKSFVKSVNSAYSLLFFHSDLQSVKMQARPAMPPYYDNAACATAPLIAMWTIVLTFLVRQPVFHFEKSFSECDHLQELYQAE